MRHIIQDINLQLAVFLSMNLSIDAFTVGSAALTATANKIKDLKCIGIVISVLKRAFTQPIFFWRQQFLQTESVKWSAKPGLTFFLSLLLSPERRLVINAIPCVLL